MARESSLTWWVAWGMRGEERGRAIEREGEEGRGEKEGRRRGRRGEGKEKRVR